MIQARLAQTRLAERAENRLTEMQGREVASRQAVTSLKLLLERFVLVLNKPADLFCSHPAFKIFQILRKHSMISHASQSVTFLLTSTLISDCG